MKSLHRITACVIISLLTGAVLSTSAFAAEPSEVISLWPNGNAPGPTNVDPEQGEQLVTGRRRTFKQYTNISDPTVAVFMAPKANRTGAAVLVCPGGGMQRLAYEHEGLEIADWLNPLGISVFVLKYRVPGPSSTALHDAQRAMGIIRSRADEFRIDQDRIGVMGFSAGGELALLMATHHGQRGYDAIDAADQFPSRPTHACLIYPGGITSRRTGELRQDIADKLDPDATPSMFVVHAFPDSSQNSFVLGAALKKNRVPCEMHIYQEGGHGFGARESALPLSGWKASYVQWIQAQGFFDAPFVAGYARSLASGLDGSGELKAVTDLHADATLSDAFAIQRKVVRSLTNGDEIIGYKSGPVTTDPFSPDRPDGPATGVLMKSGRTTVDKKVQLDASELGPVVIETELGFVVSKGLDISTRIANVDQIKGAFESVVKVIEMPRDLKKRMGHDLTSVDLVAANIGSNRILVSREGISPDDFDPDSVRIVLTHDGKELHSVSGNPVEGGLWERLVVVVNRIVDQGYTLRSGDIVISGALGVVHPIGKGKYVADYGDLGTIEFAIQ